MKTLKISNRKRRCNKNTLFFVFFWFFFFCIMFHISMVIVFVMTSICIWFDLSLYPLY